jgi:hypothetical protein
MKDNPVYPCAFDVEDQTLFLCIEPDVLLLEHVDNVIELLLVGERGGDLMAFMSERRSLPLPGLSGDHLIDYLFKEVVKDKGLIDVKGIADDDFDMISF